MQVNLHDVESVFSMFVHNSEEMAAGEANMTLEHASANRVTAR